MLSCYHPLVVIIVYAVGMTHQERVDACENPVCLVFPRPLVWFLT